MLVGTVNGVCLGTRADGDVRMRLCVRRLSRKSTQSCLFNKIFQKMSDEKVIDEKMLKILVDLQ